MNRSRGSGRGGAVGFVLGVKSKRGIFRVLPWAIILSHIFGTSGTPLIVPSDREKSVIG
jgi:hypothetical protein